MIRGEGDAPSLALGRLLLVLPLVIAFTVRPIADRQRRLELTVRNPSVRSPRVGAAVETIRAGYSTSCSAGGRKFQVSGPAGAPTGARGDPPPCRGSGGRRRRHPTRRPTNYVNRESRAGREGAQGEVPPVHSAYGCIRPALAGAVALAPIPTYAIG